MKRNKNTIYSISCNSYYITKKWQYLHQRNPVSSVTEQGFEPRFWYDILKRISYCLSTSKQQASLNLRRIQCLLPLSTLFPFLHKKDACSYYKSYKKVPKPISGHTSGQCSKPELMFLISSSLGSHFLTLPVCKRFLDNRSGGNSEFKQFNQGQISLESRKQVCGISLEFQTCLTLAHNKNRK